MPIAWVRLRHSERMVYVGFALNGARWTPHRLSREQAPLSNREVVFGLMRLNHLHLHVSDVGRAREFYERWFGFKEQIQHGPILFLRDEGGLDLALAPDSDAGVLPDWFHFGFRLDSIEEVEALHSAMLGAGVQMRQPFENWGDLAAFRCVDKDGHQIEVYWE